MRADEKHKSKIASQYLDLIENFAGFADQHWNEVDGCYDAAGRGVSWARGNGGVCLVNALLLAEYPDRVAFTQNRISRETLIEHTRRAIRRLCLTNATCADPRAIKTNQWSGFDSKKRTWHWQSGLETEHWVVAAKMLGSQLDNDTQALVRQVAGAEADAAVREIPSARPGDTAADDCSWNAGILGVCAAIYADDRRAPTWDEWAKRWALNMDGRAADRQSNRIIDGKPLKEWVTTTNVYPDLTLENHNFWDLPYQLGFAALSEPIIACELCSRPIPEAFHAHAQEVGDHILKWLVMPDGDLLCPQGIDWAERDVQHSWGFAFLGTIEDQPWARAAERRCVDLLTHRQNRFHDGSIHALDFGYETDLATVWSFSYLMHKYFEKGGSGPEFVEPIGAHLFPYVASSVFRTPEMVSSVTWFHTRQAIMVSPNNCKSLVERPSFTRYDAESGTGWIRLKGERKHRAFANIGSPRISEANGALAVSFTRTIPNIAQQQIDYCGLPSGIVVVFSRWTALSDVEVEELVNHPFRWVEIDGYIKAPEVNQIARGFWNIDDKLQIQVLPIEGDHLTLGDSASDGLNAVLQTDVAAKAGSVLHDSVCVYQPIEASRKPTIATREPSRPDELRLGTWKLLRSSDRAISVEDDSKGKPDHSTGSKRSRVANALPTFLGGQDRTQNNFPVLSTLSLSLSREGEDLRRSYFASDPQAHFRRLMRHSTSNNWAENKPDPDS